VRPRWLYHVESPEEMDVDHIAYVLRGQILHESRTKEASVVDNHVDATERVERRTNEPLPAKDGSDVLHAGNCSTASRRNLVSDDISAVSGSAIAADVVDHHSRTARRECRCVRTAKTAASTSNHGDLTVE